MKILGHLFASALCFLPIIASGQPGLQQESMYPALLRFDQGYISASMFARAGEVAKAKQAIFSLEYQWQRAVHIYGAILLPDRANQELLDQTGKHLADAYQAIDHNAPVLAYSLLKNAQQDLRQLRRENGISYFFDPWYALEAQLLEVEEIVADPMLKLEDWETLCDKVDQCASQWHLLSQQVIRPELFGWNKDKLERFDKQRQIAGAKIRILKRIIDNAEHNSECAEAASAAYEAFMATLSMFGSFSTPKSFFTDATSTSAESKIQAL